MSHDHIKGPICPGCERRLALAYPGLVSWFRRRKAAYPELHISWSFRTKVEQDACFTEGKSRLRWPDSAHNNWIAINAFVSAHPELYPSAISNIKPQAKALDLFQLINGVAVFSWKFYKVISDLSKNEGAEVLWGHDFKTHKEDGDHFQWMTRSYP